MKVLIRKLDARLQRLSPPAITALGLCCALALGLPDCFTPGPMSFVLFHVLVVVFVGWGAGKWPAVAVSGVAVATMATVQWSLHRNTLPPGWVFVWNNGMRFLVLSIAGWLTAEVMRLNRNLSQLVEERTIQWKTEAEEHKATCKRLAEALERFEQVINNITQVFWLTDVTKKQMAYISPAYETVWGRKCVDLYREPQSWMAAVHPEDRDTIARRARTEQAGGRYDVEYRILRPDGAVRWIRDRAFPVRNQQGEVCRIAGIAEDITERRRTREMLQTQAAILENMAEGVVVTDEKGVIVQMNPAGERIWGFGRDEALGQPVSVLSALPGPEAAENTREVLAALEVNGVWRGRFQNRRKDGAVILCEAVISRLEIQGRTLMVAVEQDVTERARIREQLQMQAGVLESMAEAVVLVDEAGVIVLTNPALDALLGYESGELPGQPMHVLAGVSLEAFHRLFQANLEQIKTRGSATGEYLARRKDGAVLEVALRVSGMNLGGGLCLVIVGQDITERTRVERALRQSEETLRVFLNAIPTPAALLDTNGTILTSNPALVNSLGLPADQVTGKSAFTLLPAETAQSRKAAFDDVIRSRQPAQFDDTRAGRHFANFMGPVLDPAGNVTSVAILALDITERKQAEAVLRQSEQTYRALVETTGTGYLILSLTGRVLDANAEYVRLSGHHTLQQIMGRSVLEWTAPKDQEKNAAAVAECLATGAVRNLEIQYAGPNGLITPVEINGTVVQTSKGRTILALCRDITERKQAESALAKQEAVYRTLFELSPDGILLEDANGNILDVNQAICRSFGYSREELLHQNVRWFVPPQQAGEVEANLDTLRIGQSLEHEVWNVRKNGERCLMRLSEKPLVLPDGRPGILVVTRDITESKRAEVAKEVLLTLGEKLSAARSPVEAARAVYAAADQLWQWDSATLELYSPERDWMEPVLFCDVIDGQRREVDPFFPEGGPPARLTRIMREGAELIRRQPAEMQSTEFSRFGNLERLSASLMYVALRREGRPVGVLSIQSYRPDAYTQEDLRTLQALGDYCAGALERIRAMQALQQREEFNRTILATAMDGFFALDFAADPGGAIIDANDAYGRLLGYSRDELLQMRMADLEAAETPEEVVRHKARIMAAGADRFETRHRRKDGQEIQVEISVSKLAFSSERVFGFVRDITERKRAEAALREAHDQLEQRVQERTADLRAANEALHEVYGQLEQRVRERTAELQAANTALGQSEERYRSLVNNLNVGLYRNTLERGGRFLQANPALARIHGYASVEEFEKVRVADLYQDPGEREAFLAELLRQGAVVNYEAPLKKKDGTPIYASVNATVHRGPDGEVDWIDGMLEDITERKIAEQSLAEALELNRTLVSASTVGIAVYKGSGQCVIANQALAAITGGTMEQLLQQDFRQLKSWRADGLLAKAEAVLATGQPQELEARSRTTFGRDLFISSRFSAFTSGGERHLLAMITDETEAARAHKALRDSEERYRALAESSPDAIFILDRDIKVQYVNPTAAGLWHRPPEELIGLTQQKLFPPEAAQYHCKLAAEVFETGKPVRRDEPLAFPTGEQWIEIRLAPLYGEQGTVTSVMGICRDITERKRAERQLAEALDLNQKMIAVSSVGIAAYKATGECVFANEALTHIVGGSRDEMLKNNFRQSEAWRKSGKLQLAEEVLRQGGARSGEFYGTSRFGKACWQDCHLATFVSGGQPHLLEITLEISERKRAEEALKQAERLQRAILDNIPNPAWLKDAKGRFLACNQAIAKFYAQPVETIVGKTVGDCRPAEGARSDREDQEVMTTRRSTVVEAPLSDAQGRVRWFETIKSPLFNERDEVIGTVGIARDITERRLLEHQILEISDREQARIGQDIHDGLCQQLVSLAFDANTLQRELSAQDRPETKTARRIAKFLDQAITESRQLSRGLFPVRLKTDGLLPALEELAGGISARFHIRCRFMSQGPVAMKDIAVATHLYRIAQEALANAVKHSRARTVSIRLKATASEIELRIEDDGAGLSPANRMKATGLGLHIMDYRARAIGGTFHIGPGRRHGTIVSCCAPRPKS